MIRNKTRWSRSHTSPKSRRARNHAVLETLEGRTMFSLVGIGAMLGLPATSINNPATGPASSVTYSATTGAFNISGAPVSMILSTSPLATTLVGSPSNFQITLHLDHNGNPSSSVNPFQDLVMTGAVTINGTPYSGTLLTGQIEQFGFLSGSGNGAVSGTFVDNFDFRFLVTGGLLASDFFGGKDIGVSLSDENSNFVDFNSNFSASPVKGYVAPIPANGGSAPPSINTQAGNAVVIGSGSKLTDVATVSHASFTTGSVVFKLYGPGATPGVTPPLDTETVPFTGNGTYSTPTGFSPAATGGYLWRASLYDTNSNLLAVDNGQNENEVVNKTTPCLVTSASLSYTTCQTPTTPSCNNSFANLLSCFTNYFNSFCNSGSNCFSSCSPISSGCGSSNNCGSSNCGGDSNTNAIPQDSAVLSGTYHGTGALTFTLTAPDGKIVTTQVVNVNGNGTYKTSNTVAATESGLYTWSAVYSGDNANTSVKDQGGAAEQVAVGNDACIGGTVFADCNNDGIQQYAEKPIAGTTITLTGTTQYGGAPVTLTTTTDANGKYQFSDLFAGTYTVSETTPAGYLDGKDTAGSAGGIVGNDIISVIKLADGVCATGYNFAEQKTSSVCGCIFNDRDGSGCHSNYNNGLCGVKVTLKGCDYQGHTVCVTTYTDSCGNYSFCGLQQGSYTICQTRPSNCWSSKSICGSTGGYSSCDQISNVNLGFNCNASGYNFGNRC